MENPSDDLSDKQTSIYSPKVSASIQKCAKNPALQLKTIHKSVDQLFVSSSVVNKVDSSGSDDNLQKRKPPIFHETPVTAGDVTACGGGGSGSIGTVPRNKRNSRSEDNLLDLIDSLEPISFKMKLKSSSCEANNEFKEETEHILARALQERLKSYKSSNGTIAAEKDTTSTHPYLTDCDQHSTERLKDHQRNMMPPLQPPQSGTSTDSNGLIVPKKLINPCLESGDRKQLHRELMFNQKIGKNVLNQKTELQKALQKQKERQIINTQQMQNKDQCLSGELGRVIMQRAQRLEGLQKETNQEEINNQLNPEYLNARAKLRATIDTK